MNLTRKFAQGEFDARSELAVRSDEFGSLTQAFHKMADTIAANQRTLRKSEEEHRRLVENALVGVYQVTKEGRFIIVNQKTGLCTILRVFSRNGLSM